MTPVTPSGLSPYPTGAASAAQPAPTASVTPGGVRNPDPSLPRPRPLCERTMPQPLRDIGSTLARDDFLKDTLQHPERSQAFYDREIERRQTMEDAGQEYTFEPLLTTLHNMQWLTEHILDDQQFGEPLAEDDRAAFLVLKDRIQDLIDRQAPYKRSVQLAFMMSCMQEIVTARHIMPGLYSRFPDRLERYRQTGVTGGFEFCAQPEGDAGKKVITRAEEVPLARVLSCRWGDLNPGGADEMQVLFAGWDEFRLVSQWLDNPRIFLQPSFERLDPGDFCRFSHTLVYPLGMMTAYALNADNGMMTPLEFLLPGLVRTRNNQTWQCTQSDRLLEGAGSRLLFRQQVLDKIPAALREHQLDRALELVLFDLLHRYPPPRATNLMETDSILPLLRAITCARRESRSSDTAPWQQVTDWQALLACLWVHRLYTMTAGNMTIDALEQQATQLVLEDIPALKEHLAFLERHHQTLQDHFLSRSRVSSGDDGHRWVTYTSHSRYAAAYPFGGDLTLLCDYHRDAESPMDNTDLVYFDTLHDPEALQQVAELTGEQPPPRAF